MHFAGGKGEGDQVWKISMLNKPFTINYSYTNHSPIFKTALRCDMFLFLTNANYTTYFFLMILHTLCSGYQRNRFSNSISNEN